MSKIKVMHVLCMSTFSGAENVAITLINSLKEKVNSVYVSPDGPIREIVIQNGIEHYAIKKVNAKNIRKAIKDIKPDVIHAHDFTAGVVCALAAGKIPVINHLHNNSPWLRRVGIKSVVYGLACFRFRKILTVSDSVMDEFVFGKRFRKKSMTVGNPVNLELIREKAEAPFDQELLAKAKTDLVFLGRLTPQKNVFFLLDILREVKKEKADVLLAVIGDGELRTEFEDKIREYDLAENVVMFGFQSNPYPLLKQARVMCMPSAWEGFGLAAVEALALGKPVVSSNAGGLPSIVDDSCGKVCVKKSEYVEWIEKLLTQQDVYQKLSQGATNKALQFGNMKQYSNLVYETYVG